MYTNGGNMKTKNGFTLVELLVAVIIFGLVSGIATGVLMSGLNAQRKSLASQELLSQTSYLMEYMSRAIRMAKKELCDPSCACLSQRGLNYEVAEIVPGITGLKFMNYQNVCQGFFLQEGQLKEWKDGYTQPLPLTSDDLTVNYFNIGPDDSWDQDDDEQPRVAVSLEITGKEQTKIKIQTTVSQRNLDIQR